MNLKHPTKQAPMEVVLEDGRFANMRRPTRGDFITAFGAAPSNPNLVVGILVTLTTTVDGEPITIDDWLAADFEFTNPIVEVLDRLLKAANTNPNKGGVA